MKLISKIASLSVGLALAVGVGVAVGSKGVKVAKAAGEVTVTRNATTALTTTATSIDSDANVTIKTSSANSYSSPCRLYANSTVTIGTLNNAQILSVVLTTSGSSYDNPAKNATVVPNVTPSQSGRAITWDISSETDKSQFTITPSAQVRWNSIAVTYVLGSGPSVSISNVPENLLVGGEGTFTASPSGATDPSYTWSSDTPSVLTVNASTGAYSAVAYGTAKVTVDMTCTEGNASKTVTVVVNGASAISIATAVSIASTFDDSANTTTEYTVLVEGYIISLDADSKTRAFNISDKKVGSSSDSDTIMVYGIYSDNVLRTYAILNGTLTVRAKIQNYKGTYELSSITIVSYTDAAIEYAFTAYSGLQEACNTGVEAVTAQQWSDLETAFKALDEYAQAKLSADDVSAYGEDVEHWISRYTILVEKGGFSDFMSRGLVSGSGAFYQNSEVTDNNTMIIVITIASVSTLAFTMLLVFKKKKQK